MTKGKTRQSAVKYGRKKSWFVTVDEEISHAEQHISFSGKSVLITYALGSLLRLAGVGWLARRDDISFLNWVPRSCSILSLYLYNLYSP